MQKSIFALYEIFIKILKSTGKIIKMLSLPINWESSFKWVLNHDKWAIKQKLNKNLGSQRIPEQGLALECFLSVNLGTAS